MKQEIGLLTVFLLVFLYDIFMPKRTLSGLPVFTVVAMAVVTVLGFFPCCLGAADEVTAFGGMYFTSPVIAAIKGILNIGVVLVLLAAVFSIIAVGKHESRQPEMKDN